MGEFFAFLAAFCYALSNVLVKRGTTPTSKDNGSFLSLLFNFLLAGIVVIWASITYGFPNMTGMGLFWFILGGILSSFVGRVFQYESIQHLGAVKASATKNLNPFFSVILGIIILNEKFTLSLFLGMLFIFAGIFFMIRKSYQLSREKDSSKKDSKLSTLVQPVTKLSVDRIIAPNIFTLVNVGYYFGILSSLGYALGMIVRKKGLLDIPDPFFGTMLGAVVGIFIFLILALFQERYRTAVKSTFTTFNPWLFYGGIAMALGQILNFLAIFYIEVSRTSLILATQSIFAIIFSVWIFKTKEVLTKTDIIATFAIMIGACLIAIS